MSTISRGEAASLRRMGLVSVAVLLVVGVALGALVWRALSAVRQEQLAQHQVVAERVFDEMERELSALLAREESRSFLQYRALYVPEGSLPGSTGLTRSPLAAPPEDPAIAGYFQIDPDGTASTPLSSARADATDELDARVSEVLAAVAALPPLPPQVVPAPPTPVAAVASKDKQTKQNKQKSVLDEVFEKGEDLSLREVEKSLNRGAEYRTQRKAVSKKEAALNVAQFQQTPSSAEPVAPVAAAPVSARTLGLPSMPAEIDVTLSPFQAMTSGDAWIVVWRDVNVDRQHYRQGFVLRTDALQRYLERVVFEPSGLADLATLAWGASGEGLGRLQHQHDFADPFPMLSATLSVPQLVRGGPVGELTILGLAALVLLTGALGGFAVWRTASATVALAERRNNFVAAVTHELKTPLTAIRLYAEMLREGLVASDEKRHEYYETITAETERLTRLIQNVLDLAKLEKGNRALAAAACDVGSVFQDVAHTLGPHVRESDFALEIVVQPDLPPALLDRDALVQVLVNLVDNAIKFSREAGDRRVHLEACAQGGGVVLRVRDHGPGVPARHLPLLFQPFYRGERELTRRTQGTGIGLALVAGLVRGMGGRVTARNHPDGGFEVEVWLRRAPA